MFKIHIRQIKTGEIIENYHVSNMFLAAEQFKQFVAKRGENLQLLLLQDNTELFRFDLRPETLDIYRWGSKLEPITQRSIAPTWMTAREIEGQYGVAPKTLNTWKPKLTQYYNVIRVGKTDLYDPNAVDQIIKKADFII